MSTKTTFSVCPQRATGRGWQDCSPHQAERWAVVAVSVFRDKGRKAARRKVVSTHATRNEADNAQGQHTRIARPMPKPGLGQRFKATGRRIIAQSLSYEQFRGKAEVTPSPRLTSCTLWPGSSEATAAEHNYLTLRYA